MDTRPVRDRIVGPGYPDGTVTLLPPPGLGGPRRPVRWLPMLWVPVVAAAAALLVGLSASGGPLLLAIGLVVFVATAVLGVVCYGALWWSPRRTLRLERHHYLGHLDDLRRRLGQAARDQRASAARSHPAPEHLLGVARSARRFERRPDDHHFGKVRVGVGAVDLGLSLRAAPDPQPLAVRDPVSVAAAADLRQHSGQLPDMPVAVDLAAGISALVGEPTLTRGVARALLCQAAVSHDPTEVRLVCARHADNVAAWEWVKWLPHADLVTDRLSEIANLLADQVTARIARRRDRERGPSVSDRTLPPRLVVVVDAEQLPIHDLDFRSHGVALLDLDIHLVHLVADDDHAPRQVDQWVRVHSTRSELVRGEFRQLFRPDILPNPIALAVARQLAPHVPDDTTPTAASRWLPTPGRVGSGDEPAAYQGGGRRAETAPLSTPFVTAEAAQPAAPRPLLRPGVAEPPG